MASYDPPKPPIKREGRGAALLNMLNNPIRQPGFDNKLTSTPSLTENTIQPMDVKPKPVGRGMALQQLLNKKVIDSRPASGLNTESRTSILKPSESPHSISEQGAGDSVKHQDPFDISRSDNLSMSSLQNNLPFINSKTVDDITSITSSQVQPMRLPSIEAKPPPIVKMGSAGNRTTLCTNYVALRCTTEGVCQYFVSFDPNIDCRSMRYRMLREHESVYGKVNAYDGMSLYLPLKLPADPMIFQSARPTDNIPVTITVKLVKYLKPGDCLHLYNIIFRKIMRILEMTLIGRNYFLPRGSVPIPEHKLEVWPGFITSIAEFEGGVMLLSDVSHRVLRSQTVLEMMCTMIGKNRAGAHEDINRYLVGNMILTKYNNKVYRIDDIDWSKNPSSTFSMQSGEEISFSEYYQRFYNVKIQDLQQPLLISFPKKQQIREGAKDKKTRTLVCLIPELSHMTGLTDDIRSDFRIMKEISGHTRLNPLQRKVALEKFCYNVNQDLKAKYELEKWGFQLAENLMELEGRILPMEMIRFGRNEVEAGEQADWSRATSMSEVIKPVDLHNWLLLVTDRNFKDAENFVNMYQRCAQNMGISVRKPNIVQVNNDKTESYIREIKRNLNKQVQLVMTIFPSLREDRYNSVKQTCCIEMPVPSQVVNAKTISDMRKLRSVTQKIALQINCKLGGELWSVKIPTKNLMVCGIDVHHGSAKGHQSVSGFVSSMNQNCTRWHSKVTMQDSPGEELINNLKICFIDALRKYYQENHELPSKIVIYRDGVGDGQLAAVQNFEIPQLKECFQSFKNLDYQPKMAFIVVQKRINTRLLSKNMHGGGDSYVNPVSGTIVDHTVTRRDWYDFFLVSQHVRQGTVSPSHYIVVLDELGWKVDIIQALSYKLTHLYYNWAGTVRVPAPCQYAHKLAFLVGQNIKREPSQDLSDLLFYL